jgi:hypothetical protein
VRPCRLDWLASLLVILGTLALTYPAYRPLGWALRALGDIGWVIYGVRTRQYSITTCEAMFLLIDIKGLL